MKNLLDYFYSLPLTQWIELIDNGARLEALRIEHGLTESQMIALIQFEIERMQYESF